MHVKAIKYRCIIMYMYMHIHVHVHVFYKTVEANIMNSYNMYMYVHVKLIYINVHE